MHCLAIACGREKTDRARALRAEPVQTLAVAALAEVERVRVAADKTDERVQLADAVLQRRSREAPAVVGSKSEGGLGSVCLAILDVVSLVEDDAVPAMAWMSS